MQPKPYIIVLGNEKGGTGKSTVSMHICVSLLRMGFKVATIDVDARQGTFTRYLENRKLFMEAKNVSLPLSDHLPLFRSLTGTKEEDESADTHNFKEALEHFKDHDFIVIDTPGSDTFLSRLVHSFAHTLITPLNDSFIDLDMLVRLDLNVASNVLRPSVYAEMVWEQKKERAMRGERHTIDWIVMRNRLSNLNSKNKEEMERILTLLAKRIGFRLASGFSERVIFRELFMNGLTLLDLKELNIPIKLSHMAAKQELKQLLTMIKLPHLEEKLSLIS